MFDLIPASRGNILAAPRQTPVAIVEKLNSQINGMPSNAEVKERLTALGFTAAGGTRDQFAAFIQSEITKWGKAVKQSGAKVD